MKPPGDEPSGCDVIRIHEAFQRGDLQALKSLLGDPPDFPNSPSPTLAIGNFLEYAVYHSPLPFVRTLLELGAEPNYGPVSFPCLLAALSTDRPEKYDLIDLLLSFGADIGQRGVNDYTPLHYAATLNDPRAVELLLAHGADPNARTRIDDFTTPQEEAERLHLAPIVNLLRRFSSRKPSPAEPEK